MPRRLLILLLLLAGLVGIARRSAAAQDAVDFRRQIQPLFAKHCLACHGPDKQRGGLRLDQPDLALRGGDSGPLLVPRKPAESLLLHLVAGTDPDGRVMPPKGPRLSPAEVDLLKQWIEQGADWPKGDASPSSHWSFQPLRLPAIPPVRRSGVAHPIDAFILHRLEQEGMQPAPPADRPTLLRRLHLDLIGLPPTPEETARFLSDTSPDAVEKLVDRLLASPRYGEQWARHWLDLARYADSDGYEKDLYRPHAWRWRDWVIDALNRDLPFDQFTLEQIAGDLLPGATAEQRLATGFHRNTLLNREGGVDLEEDRVKAVVDRVATVGTTWLGLTVGCAECHSHKYDPISQREFYQLYAFFNSTEDVDELIAPARLQPKVEQARRLFLAIQDQVAARFRESASFPAFLSWRREVAGLQPIWHLPERYELPTFGANNGANLYPLEDGSFLVTGTVAGNTHYIMMSDLKLDGVTAIRVEALTDPLLPRLGPGWAANGNFVLSELQVEAAPLAKVSSLRPFLPLKAVADYGQPGFEVAKAMDGKENTGWAVDQPRLPLHGVDRAAVFLLKEPIRLGAPFRMKVSLVQHHGHGHTLGRLRVSYTNAPAAEAERQAVPQPVRDLAGQPFDQLPASDQCRLLHYWLSTHEPVSPLLKTYAEALAAWLAAQGTVRGQILAERRVPRPTHIHVRGDFLHPGERVEPGFLALGLPPHSTAKGRALTRVDLAHWLLAQPLTARVAVNRTWNHLFGEGLVPSLADFGSQGDRPSHPELLDWLALQFREKGWSQKKLIKLIVLSRTYQQSSAHRPELESRDARNRLLARQNRFRLSAENVRDQILAAGGTLDPRVGGPSVPTATPRRGLYVQFKRSTPEALLLTFDAPAGTACCPKRERSNTPLQALTLLNDELYLRAARRLAEATLAGPASDDGERIRWLYSRVLGRTPSAEEARALRKLLAEARLTYLRDPAAARQLAGEGAAVEERATWTVLCRTLLNLDELLVRE